MIIKKLPILLLCVLPLLCSCNSGKLEWWEVINPSERRMKYASGRNDDSALEKYLFERADQLEAKASARRISADEWEASDPLFILNAVYFFLLLGVIILGVFVKIKEPEKRWPYRVLCLLTSLLAIASVICSLLIQYSDKNTIEFGPNLVLISYLIAVPSVLRENADWYHMNSVSELFEFLYVTLIPVTVIGGAIFRGIATYGVYIFLLAMIVYLFVVAFYAVRNHVGLFRLLTLMCFLILITLSTVLSIFAAVPAAASLISDIIMVIIAGYIVCGIFLHESYEFDDPSPKAVDTSDPSFYYSMDNLTNTYARDIDGDEVYQSKCDNKYYKLTWGGWVNVDKNDIE